MVVAIVLAVKYILFYCILKSHYANLLTMLSTTTTDVFMLYILYRKIEVERQRQLRDAEGEQERKLIKQSEQTDTLLQSNEDRLAVLRQQSQQIESDLKVASDEGRQTDYAFKVYIYMYIHYTTYTIAAIAHSMCGHNHVCWSCAEYVWALV
jgi:hypothetical protein